MNIPGLITSHIAENTIRRRRIVTHGAVDRRIVAATAGVVLIGVLTDLDADIGEHTDVVRSGVPPVEYGGTVTRGDLLTSDAQGRAVAVTLPVTEDTFTIGFAEISGVTGDIGAAHIQPGFIPAA